LGYNGGQTQAYANIKRIKEDFGIHTPNFAQILRTKIPYVKSLHSRKLAKHIDSPITDLVDLDERKYMQTLLENIPELREAVLGPIPGRREK